MCAEMVSVIKKQKELQKGKKRVFDLGINTLSNAVKRIDDRQSLHGFRSLFSTIARDFCRIEKLDLDNSIEITLQHSDKNKTRASYNHSKLKDDRRLLTDWWEEWLGFKHIENNKQSKLFI